MRAGVETCSLTGCLAHPNQVEVIGDVAHVVPDEGVQPIRRVSPGSQRWRTGQDALLQVPFPFVQQGGGQAASIAEDPEQRALPDARRGDDLEEDRHGNQLLHIPASPRGAASESLRIADALLDAYQDVHPEAAIEHWDRWDGTLREFGPDAAAAKMAVFGGADPQGPQARPGGPRSTPSPGSTPPIECCSPCRCGTVACRTSSSSSST